MRCKKVSSVKPNKVSIRLSDKQDAYLENVSSILGISKSDAIRMILDKNMSISKKENCYENKERY